MIGVIAGFVAYGVAVPRYYSLMRHAQPINATVTSKEPENHMSVWFEYQVDGRTYRGAGRAGDIGETFSSIQTGDQVPIVYDSSDPASAIMGDPQEHLKASLRGVIFISFGLLLMFVIYIWRRDKF